MTQHPVILWFRQDLRLKDNPALIAACNTGQPVLPIYILDDKNAGEWRMGEASRWWLHHSLHALNASLSGNLLVFRGSAENIIDKLATQTNTQHIYWNRCYEPWRIKRDTQIKSALKDKGIKAQSFNGTLLYEPQRTNKDDGSPYKVFTPFFKKGCLEKNGEPDAPIAAPDNIHFYEDSKINHNTSINALDLMPTIPWHTQIEESWTPGEQGAQDRLQDFLSHGLKGYKDGRDRPDQEHVSRMSPYLHFGEISPHDLWYAVSGKGTAKGWDNDAYKFRSELAWREFSYKLLFAFPELPHKNWQSKFDAFPWDDNPQALEKWQKGQTGYPIVDAGMRELWQTGYMHNRIRMICASFLIKHLMIHWQEGEKWFWDTLVDADLANNAASWQWVAGSGADAAPFFRIFNPITQGQKFDPNGDYIRRFVPEIAALPNKYLNKPWEAPQHTLKQADITLGDTYPEPIVDHMSARQRALEAFKSIK